MVCKLSLAKVRAINIGSQTINVVYFLQLHFFKYIFFELIHVNFDDLFYIACEFSR